MINLMSLMNWLSPSVMHSLGWTLLHFLWQGVLVGAIYACLRNYMADASPESRYLLSLGTLAVLAGLAVLPREEVGGLLTLADDVRRREEEAIRRDDDRRASSTASLAPGPDRFHAHAYDRR